MNRDTNRTGNDRIDSVLLFLLALAAGFFNWKALIADPFLSHPIIDAAEYLASARALAAGLPFWESVPIHGPVYTFFLTPFVLFTRSSLSVIYLAQILLVAASAVLVRSAGVRLSGRRLGNMAGVIIALAPPMLYFEVQVLPVALQVFLHSLLLYLLVPRRGEERIRLAAAGVCGGLSWLTHPGSGIALLLITLFLLVRTRPFRNGFLFPAALALTLLPVSFLNMKAGEGPLPITGNAGLNLYIGNGPGSDGTAHVRPGYEWERLTALPAMEEGEIGTGRNRFFVDRTLDAWRDGKGPFIRRLCAKALLFATAFPIDASQDPEHFREKSLPLRLIFLDAGLLVPLALAFLLIRSAWSGRYSLAALGLIGYWIGTTLTVFAVRYRAPAWPFIALLAAGLPALYTTIPKRRLVRAGAAGLVLLLLAQADPFGYRGKNPVRTDYNLGRLYYERGDLPAARRYLLDLLERTGDPDASNALGVVEMAADPKTFGRAESYFDEALRTAPDYADARFNRALLLVRSGRTEEAEPELDEAIRLAPAHAPALYTKGILLDGRGDVEGAERWYREAVRWDPTRDDTWNALGVLLARTGRAGEAEECFLRAVKLNPESRESRANLERIRRRGS